MRTYFLWIREKLSSQLLLCSRSGHLKLERDVVDRGTSIPSHHIHSTSQPGLGFSSEMAKRGGWIPYSIRKSSERIEGIGERTLRSRWRKSTLTWWTMCFFFLVVLAKEPRVVCMLGKCSSHWAISQPPWYIALLYIPISLVKEEL